MVTTQRHLLYRAYKAYGPRCLQKAVQEGLLPPDDPASLYFADGGPQVEHLSGLMGLDYIDNIFDIGPSPQLPDIDRLYKTRLYLLKLWGVLPPS